MINLTLPESVYYGENEVNKKQFMKLYKSKSLKLKWDEHAILDGKEVSGWFNADKSQYIIKHPEINHFKRLSFVGCTSIVEFFKNLGAIEFTPLESILITPPKPKLILVEVKTFIGADLASHYRTEELLKHCPNNFGVIWK